MWGYDVIGFIRIPGEKDAYDDKPVWDLDQLEEVVKEKEIDRIIISPRGATTTR